nr:putative nucleosome assembly protein c36b7.08c [Quercus suber]
MAESDEIPVYYEDLAKIEEEFEDIDLQILRQQYQLSKSTYAKRAEVISKIENFWPLVFEQAPLEIDQFIQTNDSRIFAESLLNVEVTRPELDADSTNGHPRTLHFKFTFKENPDFEDTVLEKTFWYRRAADDWTGIVSEPVKIHWKKGKDASEGLTDKALALWQARAKVGDMNSRAVPEYATLKKEVESKNAMNTSFFTWFAWVSGRRYVSAEESEKALAEHEKRKAAANKGGNPPDPAEDEELDTDDQEVEVHGNGDDVAITLTEDVWPNAIKYFTSAQEMDDEDISDAEFEDDDMDEDGEGELVDIQQLIGSSGKKARESLDGQPPSKKAKKSVVTSRTLPTTIALPTLTLVESLPAKWLIDPSVADSDIVLGQIYQG